MRVIAGSLKGRTLATPPPGSRAIRPTSDRAREALFSMLQRWPLGGLVDLFSGTGAVAVEACSRGYGPVVAVEQDPQALSLLKLNSRGTALRILPLDVAKLRAESFQEVSVVFADPPYPVSEALWRMLAPRIRPWMSPHGILIWEADHPLPPPSDSSWTRKETRRYGRAHLSLFEPC